MQYEHLTVTIAPPIATVTINRPPMNVLHIPAIEEMNRALGLLQEQKDVFVLVFRGAGEKAFSAGVDIKDHTLDKVEAMLQSFHAIFRTLYTSDWITVAGVHGYCLGGGMELALFCDWVVAEESAVFAQPEIKVGCYPPIAAAMLPRQIGYKRAMEITMLGENVSAGELHRLGLIHSVVQSGNVEQGVHDLVGRLSAMSFRVLQLTKKAVRSAQDAASFSEALRIAETIYTSELTRTKDLTEGIESFMQKRKPVWKND